MELLFWLVIIFTLVYEPIVGYFGYQKFKEICRRFTSLRRGAPIGAARHLDRLRRHQETNYKYGSNRSGGRLCVTSDSQAWDNDAW